MIDLCRLEKTACHCWCVSEEIASVSQQHSFSNKFQFYELVVIIKVKTDATPTQPKSKVCKFIATLDPANPIQLRMKLTNTEKEEEDDEEISAIAYQEL